jgi:enoyl-CoA hydratase/carnithine racemase
MPAVPALRGVVSLSRRNLFYLLTMNEDLVLYELSDAGVALLTLNRPDRMNGWTPAMGVRYFSLLEQCAADPAVRVIVVTGAGRAWCAGADLGNLSSMSSGEPRATTAPAEAADATFSSNHWYTTTVPKPVIAAINGACAGMGFSQALMCDMRFAAAGAKFTTAFSQRGLIAEWGISWTLPRVVGTGHAMDLLLSGRVVLAEEAEKMNLVNRVFPADGFLDAVLDYATTLAVNASPASWAVMKKQVYGDFHTTVQEAEANSVKLMEESFTRADFKEGVRSFLEKRPPAFPVL